MRKLICQKCKAEFTSSGVRGPKPKYCPDCSNVYYKATKKTRIINKMKYGWSKYGGPSKGLVKKQLDYWSCQSCGDQLTIGLPVFMFPFDGKDFLRICSDCQNIALVYDISVFASLSFLVRTCKPFETLSTVE